MRILVLNYEYPPLGGGASPVTHEINKRYVSAGHFVKVVTMHYKDLAIKEIVDGVHVHRVKCWRSKKHLCHPWEQFSFLIKARRELDILLESEKYDVCHVHFLVPTGILARYVKMKFDIPYILTSHGSDVPGHNPDRFKLLHYLTPPLIKRVIKDSSKVISPSRHLLGLIQNLFPSSSKYQVIPNGIESGKFVPMQKKNHIVSAGRLLAFKGFFQLVEAVKDIESDYELHIVGDGPIMAELRKKAEGSKMPIVLHGWVNNATDQYKELLGQAKIYSLVSTNENASIALLEGMSAGCATITSNQTGCIETVGDEGVCIEPSNASLLSKTIRELLADPERMDALGKKARKKVEEVYDWEIIFSSYEQALLEVSERYKKTLT